MKNLKKGDIFFGKNYADMINHAIGTNHQYWPKSSVPLDEFGVPGVIAWFVFMDGSVHGQPTWLWVNKLSMDGEEIDEYNVSPTLSPLQKRRHEEGYHPYRLAFQLDPYGDGKNNICRFVGVFRLKSFIRKNSSAMTYEKVLDDFKLGSKGQVFGCNNKDDIKPKKGKYFTPLSKMGFTDTTYNILKNHIDNAGDLLELGIGINGPLANEIENKIYECFKEEFN